MYAIVKKGSRQFKVTKGDTLVLDRISGKAGDKVKLDEVMMLGGKESVFGTPTIAGASVSATISEQSRDDKIIVFKYKRRKKYKVTRGHKQPITTLTIDEINT